MGWGQVQQIAIPAEVQKGPEVMPEIKKYNLIKLLLDPHEIYVF